MAGIQNPLEDLDILETHDAFTVSDIQTYEDIGLRPYGRGQEFIASGEAYLGNKLPTNLSGGLLGSMHSVGATGIFQVAETIWQLRGNGTDSMRMKNIGISMEKRNQKISKACRL